MDFDFEDLIPDWDLPWHYFILMGCGALFGLFTASGGFSSMMTGEQFNPGIFAKIVSAVGGAIAGYVVAWKFSD